MTALPVWAVFVVSLGTPAAAFFSVLVAQWITRLGAKELELRSRREETMRTLRWASELAVSNNDNMADLGVKQLVALLEADLLEEAEKVFVEAALGAVYEDPEAELTASGADAEAIQYVQDADMEPG